MRPIPAPRLGDAHGLLQAINQRERLRLDEFVTEFSAEELFPPGLENALGRTRQFVSYARSAGLLKEDRGTVELTDLGKRYVRSGDPENVFDISDGQAEWLLRQLRERHMTDSIYHGVAIGLSLFASNPPDFRVSTLDFGRALSHLGRAGWDNENTLLSQGERYRTLLRDLGLIDDEARLTETGAQTKSELTLPIHMSLRDLAGQLNPGGPEAAKAEGDAEAARQAAGTAGTAEPAATEPVAEALADTASAPAAEPGEDEWEDVRGSAEPPPAPPPVAPAPPSADAPAAPAAAEAPPAPPVAPAAPPTAAERPTPPADIWETAAPDASTKPHPSVAPAETPDVTSGEPLGADPPGEAPAEVEAPDVTPGEPLGAPAPEPPAAEVSAGEPLAGPPPAEPPPPTTPAPPPPDPPPPPPAAPTPPPPPDPPSVAAPTPPPPDQPPVAAPPPPAAPPSVPAPAGRAASGFLDLDAVREAGESAGLRLPDSVYAAAVAALGSGKHLVITGPPGAGKTTLALAIAKAAAKAGRSSGAALATPTPRWSSRDTLGRVRRSSDGSTTLERGHVLGAAEKNKWLILDEIDRADVDRAFGALSSFLGGLPVPLPDGSGEASPPKEWRILATRGDGDPAGPVSAAILRRFAHLRLPAPDDAALGALVDEAAGGDATAAAAVRRLFGARDLRDIGAGVFLDAARHAAERNALAPADERELARECLAAYFGPHLRGLDPAAQARLQEIEDAP